ncbi:MAG: hypothetical protein RMI56_06425 [Sulfolobales archaeon]|nr:hypothetical protein [Sulfolobales archaeon]MDW8083410.1 hypothetical protein [Sulfolobales archaeon]
MRVVEVLDIARRSLATTSSHIVLISASLPLSLLSYFTRNSEAVSFIPVLASVAGLTVVEYGKLTYIQLFYLMLISGAIPKHFNLFKVVSSLSITVPLSLATATSGRLTIVLITLLISTLLCIALHTYYVRKVKESSSATIV